MVFIIVVIVLSLVVLAINYWFVRPRSIRRNLPAMRGWESRQAVSTAEPIIEKCRSAVRIGPSYLNWPLGKVEVRGDQLLIHIGLLSHLMSVLPKMPNLPPTLCIHRDEITRLMRTGGASQHGLRIEVGRRDVVDLWGPAVLGTFAALRVSDVPIVSSRRRFFSSLDLSRPGDPFDKQ